MHKSLQIFCALLMLVSCVQSVTVFRKDIKRANKIADTFKKLSLPASEIDPNVGPTAPNVADVNSDADGITPPLAAAESDVEDPLEETTESLSTQATLAETTPLNVDDPNHINKYCKCSDTHCDCCRTFSLPILPIRGPGCAKITYLGNEKMSVSIKYGDIILATRTISGRKAKPVCVGLPGGFSEFCGRIYGLAKTKDNFKACLGLELRSDDEVEASLRVSCFKFGAKGLTVAEAEPIPEATKDEEDDDDIFGFAAGDSGEDYDDEEDEDDDDDDDDDDIDEAPIDPDADYGEFSLGGLLDDDSNEQAAAQTRTEENDVPQSKDDSGTPVKVATEAPLLNISSNANPLTQKAKKNKKKKKKSDDSQFALDLLNGILEFFN